MNQQQNADLRKFQALEYRSKKTRVDEELPEQTVVPNFLVQPKSQFNLKEGQNAHFEAKLEPMTDSNLQVEWLKDGKSITVGHRFRPIHDFGYVALDILDVIEEDAGTYTCRAVNNLGEAQFQLQLLCKSKAF